MGIEGGAGAKNDDDDDDVEEEEEDIVIPFVDDMKVFEGGGGRGLVTRGPRPDVGSRSEREVEAEAGIDEAGIDEAGSFPEENKDENILDGEYFRLFRC